MVAEAFCSLWPSSFTDFHGWNTLCFPPTGNQELKYYWVNEQWAESHRPKQKQTFWHRSTFQNRTTGCSIVFQRNKYVNLACVFSICKEKCWGSSGLFLRSGEWYDGCGVRFIDRCSSWCVSTAVLSAAEIFIWLIHLILCCVCVCVHANKPVWSITA